MKIIKIWREFETDNQTTKYDAAEDNEWEVRRYGKGRPHHVSGWLGEQVCSLAACVSVFRVASQSAICYSDRSGSQVIKLKIYANEWSVLFCLQS